MMELEEKEAEVYYRKTLLNLTRRKIGMPEVEYHEGEEEKEGEEKKNKTDS